MAFTQIPSLNSPSPVKAKLFRLFRVGISAPAVLRLGFHDCLKYKDGTGGCDGCLNWHGMGVITHVHMISLSHCASIVFLLTWLTLDEKKTWTRGTTTGWRGPSRSLRGSTPTRINQEPPLVWMNPWGASASLSTNISLSGTLESPEQICGLLRRWWRLSSAKKRPTSLALRGTAVQGLSSREPRSW